MYLLHVVGHRVCLDESRGLGCIVQLCGSDELVLKALLVDLECSLLRLLLVQAQRDLTE